MSMTPIPSSSQVFSDDATQFAILLFTDICDSTRLKLEHGALAYRPGAELHNQLFERLAAEEKLALIKNTGDGYFGRTTSVAAAVRFALRFQHGMRLMQWPTFPLTTRVGIHAGEVVDITTLGQVDILAPAADLVARIMSLAIGGQILLSRWPFDEARHFVRRHPAIESGEAPQLTWLAHGPYLFNGCDEPVEVFEVGAAGLAPLAPPPDGAKARRAVRPGEEETLGPRPAPGMDIPGRPGWQLGEKLGAGGFGEVWAGEHVKTRERRAFKFCFDAERLRALKREVTLTRLLRETLGVRDDIVHIYDMRLEERPYFLETELAKEGNLLQWAEKEGGLKAIELATRIELVAATATALAAAHSVGVLHKDIKPTNILIFPDKDGRPCPRLVDFGIGTLVDSGVLAHHGITSAGFTQPNIKHSTGTPTYSPPEYLAGHPFTVQGDIYALGVLLYQMVIADASRPLAEGWQRDVSDELLRADIATCVDGDPARRFSSAAHLATRLRALSERRSARDEERLRVSTLERRAYRLGIIRTAAAAVAILIIIALLAIYGFWQAYEAREQKKIADRQSERVAQSSSRSEFLVAAELLREDRADQALAHLARAIRLDASNSAAFLRLYTLLGQRSWPLLLRTFLGSNAARVVHLLPDQRRLLFGCSGDDNNFESKNVSSVQLWDWTTDRILAPPDNQSGRTITDIKISPDGRIAGIERSGKAGLNDNLVSFVPLLACDAPSVTINVASTEAVTAFKAMSIDCFGDDGSFALVSGIWAEKTSEEQDQFGCHAIVPTVNNLQTTDRRVHFLFWEKKPSAKTLSGLSKENWVSLNSLPKQDSLLATRFDGRAVLLLFENGILYRFDPNGNVLSKMRAFDPKPGSSFLRGAFASKSPLVALVRTDGTIEVANWRDGKRIAGPVTATNGNQWLADYLPTAPRQENTAPPPDFAFRFVNNDQTVLIERPRDDGGGILASAIWDFAANEKKAKTDLQAFRSGIHLKGDSLLSTQAGKSESYLFDREGELLCEPIHHESEVLTADVLNENLFATGSQNGFVRVWTRLTAPFNHKPGEQMANSAQVKSTLIQYDEALAEASDGAKLYVDNRIETLGNEVTAKIKVSDKEIEVNFPRWDRIYGGNFNKSGSRLVLFGGWGQRESTRGASSQGACVFDAKTGKAISPLLPHSECTWAALDPAEKWIATIGSNYIQFWDAHTFEPSGPRLVHNDAAWGAWNPVYSQRFFSMTGSGAMKIWNVDKETALHEIASSQADDQSEYSPEDSLYNSLNFNATGDRFALRRATITTSQDATGKTLFHWAGTIAIGDAETGNMLSDPVSIGFGNLRFSYDEAVRLLGWSLPLSTPSAHEVAILASLAEAVGGYKVSEKEGSTDVIVDRVASFNKARSALEETRQISFSSDLGHKIIDLPEVAQFVAQDQRTLVKNLAEGRAAFHLTEVARGLPAATSDWESVEDEQDRLIERIDFDYLEEDEDLREARRLSSEGFDRMMRGIIDNLRRRSDPIATFAAIHFGARDPELIRRAGEWLQKLRAKQPASPDDEEGANEQTEQEAILQKWEKKLGQR